MTLTRLRPEANQGPRETAPPSEGSRQMVQHMESYPNSKSVFYSRPAPHYLPDVSPELGTPVRRVALVLWSRILANNPHMSRKEAEAYGRACWTLAQEMVQSSSS